MKKILVLGSQGQVGSELKYISKDFAFEFIFADRQIIDLLDDDIVEKIKATQADYIINAAAYTAVDKAEIEREASEAINASAIKAICKASNDNGSTLIHLSTDYVYHIEKEGPITEVDRCQPQGIYAQTKWKGDTIALAECKKTVVIRTSWVYSVFGQNFVKTMLRLATSKSELNVVNDQIGSPTNARDLATAIMQIIIFIDQHPDRNYHGIYHYSNEGTISWYDFAHEIFKIKSINISLNPISTKEYNAPAPRPLWSILSKSKIKHTFHIETKGWHQSLVACLSEL